MMNLENMLTLDSLKAKRAKIRRIFFYRVCGTGMGSAATLLKDAGYDVEGGDSLFYPPMSDYLKRSKIPCHALTDVTSEHLRKFDLIVVGNVVGGKSDEARMIESLGVPFVSFPTALGGLLLCNYNVVGIAGTHGKTTTTYLAAQVFENLGNEVGYLIGGVMDDRESAQVGDGGYFFIESDEYDSAYFEKVSKFRMYELDHMILTSLEFDHADIFKNLQEIKDQFLAVIPRIKGHFILSQDYPAIKELMKEGDVSMRRINYYGDASYNGPKILNEGPKGTKFVLKVEGIDEHFTTNLIGKHNIFNLTSIIWFAIREGIGLDAIRGAITNLQMVKRRQEVRGTYRGCTVIDDFAHHPRAVDVTIDSIRARYPTKKILTVIEPNSATARSDIFQAEFAESLAKSDKLIIAKPKRPTTVAGVGDLDVEKLAKEVEARGKKATFVVDLESLLKTIDDYLDEKNDILLILSNGTCLGLWESSFVEKLRK